MEKRNRILDVFLYIVFGFYLILLFAILFRTAHQIRSINIIPFRSIVSFMTGSDFINGTESNEILRAFAFSNIVGNIVIFIPMGIYITLLTCNSKIVKTVLCVFLFSLAVEMVQFVFKLGIGDIDDVILNVLGGFIGAVLYKILYHIFNNQNLVRNIIAIYAPIGGLICIGILYFMNR